MQLKTRFPQTFWKAVSTPKTGLSSIRLAKILKSSSKKYGSGVQVLQSRAHYLVPTAAGILYDRGNPSRMIVHLYIRKSLLGTSCAGKEKNIDPLLAGNFCQEQEEWIIERNYMTPNQVCCYHCNHLAQNELLKEIPLQTLDLHM